MRRKNVFVTAALSAAAMYCASASALTYPNKLVVELQTGVNDCIYFRLEGVSVIDPPSIGGWFAIQPSASSPSYKDVFAVLLAARVSGTPVTVITTGPMICNGYTQASYVTM